MTEKERPAEIVAGPILKEQFKSKSPDSAVLPAKGPLAEKMSTIAMKALAIMGLIFLPEGRELWKSPESLTMFYDKEVQTGLLEGTIIGQRLFVPNLEHTALKLREAARGQLVSYDFNRPNIFKEAAKIRDIQNDSGALGVYELKMTEGHAKDELTPTGLLNIFNPDHFSSLTACSLEEAADDGYLEKTTYQEAYQKVGKLDQYRKFLEAKGVVEAPVYIITRKGNGIVSLADKRALDDIRKPSKENTFRLVPSAVYSIWTTV